MVDGGKWWVISQKHDKFNQFRIYPDVRATIVQLHKTSGCSKMSMTAFIDSLLRKGIEVEQETREIVRKAKGEGA